MKKRRKAGASLFCSVILVIMEIVGLVMSVGDHGWKMFMYYTQDSNYLLLIATVLWIVCLVAYLRDGVAIPMWVRVLKYMATCTVSVTLVVVLTVLAPTMAGGYVVMMTAGTMLFQHTICPILAIVSFVAFEGRPVLRGRHVALALVPTLIYAFVSLALNLLRVWYGPYPFLHVYEQAWWMSIVWFAVILLGALVLAWLLYALNRSLHREYVY